MRATLRIVLILCLSWEVSMTVASGDNSSNNFTRLEDHMSPEELDATGVAGLSAEEREQLNAWIADYFLRPGRNASQSGNADTKATQESSESQQQDSGEIVARVVSDFNGWTGNTVFKLDNGQVWKQRQQGRYIYAGEDTKVIINKNWLGFYELYHPASDRSVGVTRLD